MAKTSTLLHVQQFWVDSQNQDGLIAQSLSPSFRSCRLESFVVIDNLYSFFEDKTTRGRLLEWNRKLTMSITQ